MVGDFSFRETRGEAVAYSMDTYYGKYNSLEPLVSVIVPVYNVGNYLEQCLRSVVDQMYEEIDAIFIDDRPTDGSSSVCDEFAACMWHCCALTPSRGLWLLVNASFRLRGHGAGASWHRARSGSALRATLPP